MDTNRNAAGGQQCAVGLFAKGHPAAAIQGAPRGGTRLSLQEVFLGSVESHQAGSNRRARGPIEAIPAIPSGLPWLLWG